MWYNGQDIKGSFHYGKEHNDVGKDGIIKIVFSAPERGQRKDGRYAYKI